MTVEHSPSSANSPQNVIFKSRDRRIVAIFEHELTRRRRTEIGLRAMLPRTRLCFIKRTS